MKKVVKSIIDIEKFRRLTLRITDPIVDNIDSSNKAIKLQNKKDLKKYIITYSDLIFQRIKLKIYYIRSDQKPEEFSNFLSRNPRFEEETKSEMEGYEVDIAKELETYMEGKSSIFEDLIKLTNKNIERRYTERAQEFYKSEYYNRKEFDYFLAAIGEIFQQIWSENK